MPKKILLADDSITIQKVVELTFSDGDYEVTAVNNGAKAVQKLAEMRPDIILSDIIMPEKNGYEVCEFVKSHPEYRTIPVILLTGTFEPFDPDRADKAGCDAVVTKPFESQSLIHKVEELIEQSRSAAPARPATAPAPPPAAPQPEPSSPWAAEEEEKPAPPSPADIFAAPRPASGRTTEMPLSAPPAPSGGETQAVPAFGSRQGDASATTQQFTPPSTADQAPSPWGEPPPTGGETRAFPKTSFEDLKRMAAEKAPDKTPQESDESPFGAPPPAEEFSGETRAFPKLTFDELQNKGAAPGSQQESAAGETRAFPQMSFEQLSRAASEMPAAPETSPAWSEPESSAPAWESREESREEEPPAKPFSAPQPARFGAEEEEERPEPQAPAWGAAPVAAPSAGNGVDLTEEQIDRIARRVVQLMSDQVVRNIAWEVIPDMAEMVVKERIRQLESES